MKKFSIWLVLFIVAAAIDSTLGAGVLLAGIAYWLVQAVRGKPSSSAGTQTGELARPPRRGSTHHASAPQGTPVEPWATSGATKINAVGESHHSDGFRAALADWRRPLTPQGIELNDARVAVVTDPRNPFDADAVAVWIEGRHLVGYLPGEIAAQYAPALAQLEAEGSYLRVPARVWVAERDGVFGSVSMTMPPPSGVHSFNELPEEPHAIIPPGRALQVTGEDSHMDVLTRYLSDHPRYIAVTLHEVTEAPKSAKSQPAEVIEIQLDGKRIGVLSKAMGDQVRDLVRYLSARRHLPVARAVLKGSSIKADVTLYVARSSEVPQSWLDKVRSPADG